jgi:hypothetical protein
VVGGGGGGYLGASDLQPDLAAWTVAVREREEAQMIFSFFTSLGTLPSFHPSSGIHETHGGKDVERSLGI